MKRVRFLEHAMGMPGPVACYLQGEIAEVDADVYEILRTVRTETDRRPFAIDAPDEAARDCPECDRKFALGALTEHLRFWHYGEDTDIATVTARMRNAEYPQGEGDYICMACRRSFDTPKKLRMHRTTMHDWIDDGESDHDQAGVRS